MRVLLQRVNQASVKIEGEKTAEIGKGVLLLVGIGEGDGEEQISWLVNKIANLRIFEDLEGKMNLSLLDIGGEALVVSQFTLYADTRKGRRPSFTDAAPPEKASPLVDLFAEKLSAMRVPTRTGTFAAHMQIELVNDGPVTIWLER